MADPGPPPTPDAPGSPGAPLTLEEHGRLLGGHLWVDLRLFEVLGGFAVPSGPAGAAVAGHLAEQAQRHAWHAALWRERLPLVPHLRPEAVVAPPAGWAAALDALAAAEGDGPRLAASCRVVLPRLVVARSAHLARCRPVADAAYARALRLALADAHEAWSTGEALLQAALRHPADLERALAAAAAVEAPLLAA